MALGITWCYSFNHFQHIWYAYGKVVVPSSWRGDWGHPRMSVPWPQLWHVIVDAGSVQTQFTSNYWSCNLWTEHLFKIYTCQNSSLLQHFCSDKSSPVCCRLPDPVFQPHAGYVSRQKLGERTTRRWCLLGSMAPGVPWSIGEIDICSCTVNWWFHFGKFQHKDDPFMYNHINRSEPKLWRSEWGYLDDRTKDTLPLIPDPP